MSAGGSPSPSTVRGRLRQRSVLVEESPRRDSKTTGQSPDHAYPELALTSLEEADLGTVQAGPVREDLLRQAGLLPQAPHAETERPDEVPVVSAAPHPTTVLARYGSVDYG